MTEPRIPPQIDAEPAVATWELWTVASMLISTHGERAEAHAMAKLAEAEQQGEEGQVIVWTGVITQLKRIREGG